MKQATKQPKLPAIPESVIQGQIKTHLQIMGWMVTKIHQSLGSEPGIPDLIAIKNCKRFCPHCEKAFKVNIVLFIEVKAKRGKLSRDQENYRDRLLEQGGNYLLARGIEDIEKAEM